MDVAGTCAPVPSLGVAGRGEGARGVLVKARSGDGGLRPVAAGPNERARPMTVGNSPEAVAVRVTKLRRVRKGPLLPVLVSSVWRLEDKDMESSVAIAATQMRSNFHPIAGSVTADNL